MNKKVRFGIIGIGNMGSAHVHNLTNAYNTELTAVCDINPEAFKRMPSEIAEKVQKFTDTETFFREAEIDAVIVAVPHYFHPDLAIRAMECGKHVIVEKPIAVHKAEAERLLKEAEKYPNLVKSAMFNQRTLAAHRKIKMLIENGELGRINRINWIITDWFRTQSYYDSGDWRATWRGEGGGVLLNQLPHQLDLFQWFFGMPDRVSAAVKFGKYHDIEVEDEINAYIEYDNGTTANLIATTGEAPGTNRLEIAAERGRLVFERGKLEFIRNEIETSVFCRTAELGFAIPDNWTCEIPYADSAKPQHQVVIENVAEAILNGAKLIAPLSEGIRGLELGNAVMLSGWRGAPVTLPIDSAEYASHLATLVETSRYKQATSKVAAADDFAKSY